MCGIFGYYNFKVDRDRRAVLELLFNGLRRLEYRGYDSAGVAVDGDAPVSVPAGPRPAVAGAGVTARIVPGSPAKACGGARSGAGAADGPAPLTSAPAVFKASGKVDALVALAYEQAAATGLDLDAPLRAHAGIAHTRWATHGPPTATNAHPHASGPAREFVVVHNGIITNHAALRDFLVAKGFVFESETDTEVIPKLLEYVHSSLAVPVSLPELVLEVLAQLEGAFALLIKSTHHPGELVAAKRGSPLILGIREAPVHASPAKRPTTGDAGTMAAMAADALECFLASDASAFIEHTKKVVVLEDDDVLHLCRGAYGIYNVAEAVRGAGSAAAAKAARSLASPVPRVLSTLEMEVASIMKGGYDHFMAKEIHEQPESILQTMRGRVKFAPAGAAGGDPYLEHRITLGGLSDHLPAMRRSRRLLLVACGTSYHACLASRQTLEELADVPVGLELASDLMDRRAPIARDDAVVFVSQSGETADTLAALRYARAAGALCVGVTNTVGSAIARGTDCGVHINAGCEIGVASTKAYTSQIVALTMMALALSDDSIGRRAARDAVIDDMARLPGAVKRALGLDGAMRELAASLVDETSLLVFGRGYNYATALEAALKVKEVSLMHSEGILAGEMKHGPLALVDDALPIVVVATRDRMHGKMLSVIAQLRARSARLIVVCNEGDDDVSAACGPQDALVRVPHVVDALQPVVNIVPLQLLAYHLTVLRGHDVDQPRNLAKSVTVTED